MSTVATGRAKSPCNRVSFTRSGSDCLSLGQFARRVEDDSFIGAGSRTLHKSSPVFHFLPPQRCEAPQRGTELWWHYFMNQVFFFFLSFCNYTTFCCDFVHSFRTPFLGTSCCSPQTSLVVSCCLVSRLLTEAMTGYKSFC